MKIWIDLENAPHILFFSPIIKGLHAKGFETVVTARNLGQTLDMARLKNLTVHPIGEHYEGNNKLRKISSVIGRSLSLVWFILRQGNVKLAAAHSSRSLTIAAKLLGIPSVNMMDYEAPNLSIFNLSTKILVPEALELEGILKQGIDRKRIETYPALKEAQYIGDFTPEPDFLERLGIAPEKVLIAVRPPATLAHYHNPEGDALFLGLLEYLAPFEAAVVLVTARYRVQAEEVKRFVETLRQKKNLRAEIRVLEKPIDGLNLMWIADAVVSGGGTMNREAALIGTPAYTIFKGTPPSVESELVRTGRIVRIETASDFSKLRVEKKPRLTVVPASDTGVLEAVIKMAKKMTAE